MDSIELQGEFFKKYIDSVAIAERIKEMSLTINENYKNKNPHFLIVLNGAFMFGSEILKKFEHDCMVDFIRVRSYSGMKSTGSVDIKDLDNLNLAEKDILILEDLIDTGRTLFELVSVIRNKKPNSIRIAALFLKKDACQFDVEPDFVGFNIPNQFIIGYGTDYNGLGRNLPHIYIRDEII